MNIMNLGKKISAFIKAYCKNPRGREGRSADQADEVPEAVHSIRARSIAPPKWKAKQERH